jgi:hypothetical protein
VTIIDLTSEDKWSVTDYVKDTAFIVPASFVPTDARPHIFRWSVYIARQIGGDEENGEVWEIAGNRSEARVFAWVGAVSSPSSSTD